MWNGKWGPFEFGMKETRQGWRSVQKNIQHAFLNGIETDGILGAGDQIYADFAGKLAYAQSLRDFVKRYHLPYSSDEFKAVTSQIPYQTIPDDHAVTNDSGARDHYSHSKKGLQRFDNGMSAARLLEFPPEQPDNCYWRETLIGNVPIFFADLRRERDKVEGRIMGETQFKALKVFLMLHQQTIPLLVFSVPFSTQDGHGSCTDYPIWQKELMEFAQEQQLKFVIFSGDTHVGYTHVFQAKDSDGKNVGRPVLEATVSGFHAHSHGKAPSTKSIIDRTSQGGLRFESTSPINVLHPAADKKHPVHKKDLFARMTFDHETDDVHIEYFRIKNNQKLMGLTYHSIEGTSKWDE
jgi:phosphodiesterase/alkaline phosphatase D-like protein